MSRIPVVVLALLVILIVPTGVSTHSGTFDAAFDPKAGNEWWVEVYVDANHGLAGVEARANGGEWQTLTLRDWGAWAGSFHVPDGSTVEFRATSDEGDTDVSQGYIWPDATPVGSGGDGTFDAAFDPKPGNEWWVEVYVDANEPLKGVDARANGGEWQTLTLRDWGAWAGSFHIPDGSTVEFRATSNDGDTDHSQGYIWPEATPAGSGGDSTFDAAFDPKPGNEWWVEVYVDANEPLKGVDARANGGEWQTLTLRDWGAWAGSFHIPDGSIVEFRATSDDGDTDHSQGYVWPDATPTGDSGGEEPTSLDVAFGARAGNEWWVETYVVADATIVKVEARADGGAWHTLTERSWGTWAGSFHAPEGSTVEFRATANDGATDLSDGFRWPDAVPAGQADEWPREGSYLRYETWEYDPGGYAVDGYQTRVYHNGEWWMHAEWEEGFEDDKEHHEKFTTDGTFTCPHYGPTEGVSVGDDVDIEDSCGEDSRNATVREQTTDELHVDGESTEVEVWYATDRDPCNCIEWQVSWDRDMGLVTYSNVAGRGANGLELVDTNAPIE